MGQVFTEYVRSLDPAGEPPDGASFERVWRALRRLLEGEIRRRGLWLSPPSYLGVVGWSSWSEGVAGATSRPGVGSGPLDALDELVSACYVYVFLRRLRGLLVHLEIKPTIDGLVTLNARHFLYEAQKRHDRLGFRVFQILHAAVAEAVASGGLFVLRGGPTIRNDTVLGFRSETAPDALTPSPLQGIVERWNDVLLPELVEARGKRRKWVIATLTMFLARLPAEGVAAFRFRELIDPLKNDVRARRALDLRLAQGPTGVEDGGVVTVVPPDPGDVDREKLRRCMEQALTGLDAPAKAKVDLRNVWKALYARHQRGEDIPTRRQLAEKLAIPRRRLAQRLSTLGELIEICRGTQVAPAAADRERRTAVSTGGAIDVDQQQAEALRRRTGEARRRHAAIQTKLGERAGQPPRPGDLYLLPAAGERPVEWAVVEEASGRLLALPADDHPIAGRADLAVPAHASCGPLTVRCASGIWLDAAAFAAATRTGSLPSELVELARRQWRAVREDAAGGPAAGDERDDDPEHGRWIAEVLEPARAAVAAAHAAEPRPRRRSHRRPFGNPYALAASVLLLVSLGMGGGMVWQRQRIVALEDAALRGRGNIPFHRLRFTADGVRSGRQAIVVPAAAGEIFLLLNVFELAPEPAGRYRLAIVQEGTEREIWSSEALHKVDAGSLTVALPTRLFPPGDYRFQLYPLAGDRDRPLAEIMLRLDYR